MKKVIVSVIIIAIIYYMSRNKIIKTVFSEQLTKNFQLGELLVTAQPFPNIPNEKEKKNLESLAINVLQPVRDLLDKPISINSAFRSYEVNKAVGGVDNSQHRIGLAADFHVNGLSLEYVFQKIAKSKIPFDQLIIEYGKHPDTFTDDWIHISYNPNGGRRQLLTASFDEVKKKIIYNAIKV